MRTHGIQAHRRRPFRKTTDSNHAFPPAPNLSARQFASAVAPNQVWLADMTYIATGEGWLYLAVVLDLFSRKVVGWAMALNTRPRKTLGWKTPAEAFDEALLSAHTNVATTG